MLTHYLLPPGARVGLCRPGRGAVGAAGGAPALRRPHLPGAPATCLAYRGALALVASERPLGGGQRRLEGRLFGRKEART